MDGNYLREASYWSFWPVVYFFSVTLVSIAASNWVKVGPTRNRLKQNRNILPWEILGFVILAISAATGSIICLILSTSFYFAGAANGRIKSILFLVFLLLGVALLIPTAAYGKRLLIFPIVVVLAIAWRERTLSSKTFYIIFSISISSILPLSIMRGYGDFGAESFTEALSFVTTYISQSYFLAALGNNTEAVPFYFHGMNSMQSYLISKQIVWGETILNMFFLGSSIYGFEDGLRSSIEIYTAENYPSFRQIGGSYPIMVLSEFTMNFGVFSFIIFPAFLVCLDGLWRVIIHRSDPTLKFALEASFIYVTLLLARGASFDLSLFNFVVLALPLVTIVTTLGNKMKHGLKRA